MNTERILKVRQMDLAGEFDRVITARKPLDIYHDEVVLECGHTALQVVPPLPYSKEETRSCSQCAKAWLEQEE